MVTCNLWGFYEVEPRVSHVGRWGLWGQWGGGPGPVLNCRQGGTPAAARAATVNLDVLVGGLGHFLDAP